MTNTKPQFQIFLPLVWVVDNRVRDYGNEEAYAAFTYDENGIRTSEQSTEDSLTFDFRTEDGAITGRQSADGKNYRFIYDESGRPTAFMLNGALYHYITNQMGDVVGVTDADGNLALEYFYDAWGDNFTAAPDSCDYDGKTGWDGAYRLYNDNPIKYRGYYFDHTIGLYYLQSRYFHTDINRFFNADDPDIARESKDIPVGMNLFAYCNNDPVNGTDPTGCWSGVSVYYYKLKKGVTKGSTFGHLDIRIDNTIYSYAKYKSGNFLITSEIKAYHDYQKSKYTIYSKTIKVTNEEKYDIKSFYNEQKNCSKVKATATFSRNKKSKIRKINSGEYKTYHLTSRNCATFVLDGLRCAFGLTIFFYRLVQRLYYIFSDLDTPKKVFEIVGWLADARS